MLKSHATSGCRSFSTTYTPAPTYSKIEATISDEEINGLQQERHSGIMSAKHFETTRETSPVVLTMFNYFSLYRPPYPDFKHYANEEH